MNRESASIRRESPTTAPASAKAAAEAVKAAPEPAALAAEPATITDVRVIRLSFGPRKHTVRNATWAFRDRRATIIRVETDAGVSGTAVTARVTGFGDPRIIEGPLKEAVVGENPFDTERLWEKMFQGWRKAVPQAEVLAAISGVDIALWDLLGRLTGKPVTKLMGGYREEVPVYAAGGYYREDKDIDGLVEEMTRYVALGYRAVKMKVGGADFAHDVRRVAAVREAVGDDVQLMLDANGVWTAYEAVRFLRAVEKYEPAWIEEPVHPEDVAGCVRVRQMSPVPVAAGENRFTRFGHLPLLTAGAVDILQPDACTTGGVTEWRKIAAVAGACHVPVAPHGDPLVHLHLVASTPNGLIVEVYPEVHAHLWELVRPFPVKDGKVRLGEGPGFGIELNEEAVAKHAVG